MKEKWWEWWVKYKQRLLVWSRRIYSFTLQIFCSLWMEAICSAS
jgi:hypothetical protein